MFLHAVCDILRVTARQWNATLALQELLLRLVEDYYPLPSNPSQDPPSTANGASDIHSSSAQINGSGAPNGKSAASALQPDKKRKRVKAAKEISPKSRRTKKSVKASKGIEEALVKAEVEAEVGKF